MRAVNAVEAGPVTGAPVDLAISTGDNTDNSQANELELVPRPARRRSRASRLRRPGALRGHRRRRRLGRALLAPGQRQAGSVRARSTASPMSRACSTPSAGRSRRPACARPWLAVHGNHDQLLQGTVPGAGRLAQVAVGGAKPIALPGGLDAPTRSLQLLAGLAACDPGAVATPGGCPAARGHPRRRPSAGQPGAVRPGPRARAGPPGRARLHQPGPGVLPPRRRAGELRRHGHGQRARWLGGLARPRPARLAGRRAGRGRRRSALRRGRQPPSAGDAGQPDRRRPDAGARGAAGR